VGGGGGGEGHTVKATRTQVRELRDPIFVGGTEALIKMGPICSVPVSPCRTVHSKGNPKLLVSFARVFQGLVVQHVVPKTPSKTF